MRCENNAGKPWVLTPSADDFVEVKSGNFSVNCLRKIMTELLSVFLRLCVRLLSQSYCVGVNYQHCNLIYRGVMIWSVNAVVPNLHPFPPSLPPPPHALVSAILEGVTLCLMIIHSHLSFSAPPEEVSMDSLHCERLERVHGLQLYLSYWFCLIINNQ